jgi:hypothetical protein
VAWLEKFHAFSPKAQKAFNLCDFSGSRFSDVAECSSCSNLSDLLASLGYPLHNKGEQLPAHKEKLVNISSLLDGCRAGCDLMNLFFVIDHYTDIADPAGARDQANVLMDVLRNPHMDRPPGEWIGGEVARQ